MAATTEPSNRNAPHPPQLQERPERAVRALVEAKREGVVEDIPADSGGRVSPPSSSYVNMNRLRRRPASLASQLTDGSLHGSWPRPEPAQPLLAPQPRHYGNVEPRLATPPPLAQAQRVSALALFQAIRELSASVRAFEKIIGGLAVEVEETANHEFRLVLPDAFCSLHSQILAYTDEIYNGLTSFLAHGDPNFGLDDQISITQEFREVLTRIQMAQCKAESRILSYSPPYSAIRNPRIYAAVMLERSQLVSFYQGKVSEVNDVIRRLATALKEACRRSERPASADSASPGDRRRRPPFLGRTRGRRSRGESGAEEAGAAKRSRLRVLAPYAILVAVLVCLVLAALVIWFLKRSFDRF